MAALALRVFGAAAVAVGLAGIALGSLWAPQALDLVYGSGLGFPIDVFVPFLPIFAIALGALLLVRSRR